MNRLPFSCELCPYLIKMGEVRWPSTSNTSTDIDINKVSLYRCGLTERYISWIEVTYPPPHWCPLRKDGMYGLTIQYKEANDA